MSENKGIDIEHLNLVDNSSLPKGRIRSNKWMEIFDRIPAGKSWFVTEKEVSLTAVRSAVSDLHSKGLYKHIKVRKIKEKDGSYTMYVVNESPKTNPKK